MTDPTMSRPNLAPGPLPDPAPPSVPCVRDRWRGVLLGTAVGDALGLPAENLSARRLARWWPGPWRHRFCCGCGMISDDTEHTLLVGQALLAAGGDVATFRSGLASSLRWWIAGLPAGVGFATLRACAKLWLGFSPERSGVFSAGNGPAMRVAPIGARFAADPARRAAFVAASTRMTHTDPRALTGARAIAEIVAACFGNPGKAAPPDLGEVRSLLQTASEPEPGDGEWLRVIELLIDTAREHRPVAEFAAAIGCGEGVGGYVYQTVPVAIYAWWRHWGDFRATVESVLALGGDTDTVGAITGALAGATTGASGIPVEWVDGIRDWPRGIPLLTEVADRLANYRADGAIIPTSAGPSLAEQGGPPRPTNAAAAPGDGWQGRVRAGGVAPDPDQMRNCGPAVTCWPAIPVRNLVFLVIVLLHGLRRLLPPW